METKKISVNDIKAMSLEQVNNALAAGGLNPAQKQALMVRKANLEEVPSSDTPVEDLQAGAAADAVTSASATPEAAAPVAAKSKNKPYETTRTITAFADDTKGIRAGDTVTFTEHKGGTGKVLTGQVQRLFDFYLKPERQEAKIMVTDAKGNRTRFYRFEKDITKVVPEVVEEAPKAEDAPVEPATEGAVTE